MSETQLRLGAARPYFPAGAPRLPLGRQLVEDGVITPDRLVRALDLQQKLAAPLGQILISEGWADRDAVYAAVAAQHDLHRVDLMDTPPDPTLASLAPVGFWLRHRVIPWMRMGGMLVIAMARPDRLAALRADWPGGAPPFLTVVADDRQIMEAIGQCFSDTLANRASTRVPRRFSCRTWVDAPHRRKAAYLAALLGLLGLAIFQGWLLLGGLSLLAVLGLWTIAGLKAAGCAAQLTASVEQPPPPSAPPSSARLPRVSVLVPLYKEKEIAGALVSRLSRLSYPKALLDVILVLEAEDDITRHALDAAQLPAWMRIIEVPAHGGLTTKPRAMNYALDFCDGDIIGVWDAEDAPTPDQIDRVVARFADAPEDVVCLQGVLDFYNPRTNWLARCFTIEYASWFRVVLPGLARLGLVIPLGGTTLFVRRAALEKMGGWDAHNVTEDADLGVRISRYGYRTELIATTTYEEANCRVWPWIKQRSRWLKGFMVTYLVHMRRPGKLFADLGLRRFVGLQAFFLGTLSQFLLAPLLWSYWLVTLGAAHPAQSILPAELIAGFTGLFVAAELVTLSIGLAAVSGRAHRHLLAWVPTLVFYYPLGAVAAYKALYELVSQPYYWDKTQHGHAPAE